MWRGGPCSGPAPTVSGSLLAGWSTSAGPAATPPAVTATTLSFARVAPTPAEPAPDSSSATRAPTGSVRAPTAASQFAVGIGVTAVAAARSAVRARCTSWRSAPSESPIARAISSWERPSKAMPTSAVRWRSGSVASSASVRLALSRRSSSSCGTSPVDSDPLSSACSCPFARIAFSAVLWTMVWSHGRSERTSSPRRSPVQADSSACCTTSSA